jgi:hypothetical protein
MNNYGIIEFDNPQDSGGFFSNYFSVLSTIGICVDNDLIPYVDASNTWFNPTCDFENNNVKDLSINPWNWWFEQSLDSPNNVYGVKIFREYISHDPSIFNTQPNLKSFREIAEDYFKIQNHILEEENLLYETYFKNKTTLGILARGTEMLLYHPEYPKVQLQSWPEVIETYLKANPDINNIFLVSDDNEIIDTIISKFPYTFYLKDFFRKTNQSKEMIDNKYMPWWLISPTNDPNHRKRLGEECLIQAKLLSRCKYFLGTYSGISNAVQFFNNDKFIKSSII